MIFDNTIATFAAPTAWFAAGVQQARPNKGKSPHYIQLNPVDPTKWYSLHTVNSDIADQALYTAWIAGRRAELEAECGAGYICTNYNTLQSALCCQMNKY